jgi:hypothetical protein
VHGLGFMMFGLAVQKFLNIEMISPLNQRFSFQIKNIWCIIKDRDPKFFQTRN